MFSTTLARIGQLITNNAIILTMFALAYLVSTPRRRFIAMVAFAVLALAPTAAFAKSPPSAKRASDVDLTVVLTKISKTRAGGSATFTAITDTGVRVTGNGTVSLTGRKTATGFRTAGTGSLNFTAVGRRSDGTTLRISNGRGTLQFVGGYTEGTGMIINDATLQFLGGSTDGTGI